ncbi:hypothetical protein GQ44DRAFT_630281 [Phaeosphaeriaceae sp. PMI808]|nr:hypothetical protein GQ44DRAFT_630281 [Phaeosphaeriaceae sp. PMI808]
MEGSTLSHEDLLREAGLFALQHGARTLSPFSGTLGTRLILIHQHLDFDKSGALVRNEVSPDSDLLIVWLKEISQCSLYPSNKAHIGQVQEGLKLFLKSSKRKNEREKLLKHCDALCKRLNPDETIAHIMAGAPKIEEVEYPRIVKMNLLTGLRQLSRCFSCSRLDESQGSPRWHPTQLLLKHRLLQDNKKTLEFSAIVAGISPNNWQDIGLSVPLKVTKVHFEDGNTPHEAPSYQGGLDADQGRFCSDLQRDIHARICFNFKNGYFVSLPDGYPLEQRPTPGFGITLTDVLQRYTLHTKDKINLVHIVAHAFGQFYDTQLLYRKWTSNCILFMPERDGDVHKLPNNPYISIQFELANEDPDEYLSENTIIHRYPRILAFAIILIEIGLGRSLKLQQSNSIGSQANNDFEVAKKGLTELKGTSWANFANKNVFIEAIDKCLQGRDYSFVLNEDISASPAPSPVTERNWRESPEISQRRRIFYQKVVWPLEWLARAFQCDQNAGYLIENQNLMQLKSTRPSSAVDNFDEDVHLSSPQFHGGEKLNPKRWLDHLKTICRGIAIKLRKPEVKKKEISVAILDTGYDPKAPIFEDKARSRCFNGWKDFVSGSEVPVDEFGHGTFMATLLVEVAPISKVYVARVAKETESLMESSSQIAKGIIWAGIEQSVDIIFMSLGFPAHDREKYASISEAIEEVRKQRSERIIFLASAGNSAVFADETFPATHPSVISIRATDSQGAFLKSNPPNKLENAVVIGTIGDDIPSHLVQFRPGVCLPGSSAATAVAAGIAAIFLAYGRVLPHTALGKKPPQALKNLWRTEGMRDIFLKISDDMGQRRRFLNPWKFFLDYPDDMDKYTFLTTKT